MSFVEVAQKFFALVETGKGAAAIAPFLKPNSSQRFESQTAVLADIHDIKSYADWMQVLLAGITPDGTYDLHNVAVDNKNRAVIFFATFKGTHTGEKGPVKATGRSTESDYVYVVRFDAEKDLVVSMTKVWNDGFASRQFGWAK